MVCKSRYRMVPERKKKMHDVENAIMYDIAKGKNMQAIVVCITEIRDRITNFDMQFKRAGYCEVAGMRLHGLQKIKHNVLMNHGTDCLP